MASESKKQTDGLIGKSPLVNHSGDAVPRDSVWAGSVLLSEETKPKPKSMRLSGGTRPFGSKSTG